MRFKRGCRAVCTSLLKNLFIETAKLQATVKTNCSAKCYDIWKCLIKVLILCSERSVNFWGLFIVQVKNVVEETQLFVVFVSFRHDPSRLALFLLPVMFRLLTSSWFQGVSMQKERQLTYGLQKLDRFRGQVRKRGRSRNWGQSLHPSWQLRSNKALFTHLLF